MANLELNNLIKLYLDKNSSSQILDYTEFELFYNEKNNEMFEEFYNDLDFLQDYLLEFSNESNTEIETAKSNWKEIVSQINKEYKNNSFKAKFDDNIKNKNEILKIHNYIKTFKKTIRKSKESHYLIVNLIIVLQTRSYPRVTLSNYDDVIYLIEFFQNNSMLNNAKQYWFRGQSNYTWDLIPSMYRNIDRKTSSIVKECRYIDDNEIYGKLYDPSSFYGKYSNVFKKDNFGYDFVSYMQHSISFSPLIDFTSNFIVSLSFATSNKSAINDFNNQDSSIFMLIPNNELNKSKDEYDYIIKENKVGIYADKMKSNDYIKLFNEMGHIYSKNPKVFLLDSESNDRMKYQSGKFILYSNYFIHNRYSFPRNTKTSIIKLKINKEIKNRVYDYINKRFPEFELDNLLNPYRVFTK